MTPARIANAKTAGAFLAEGGAVEFQRIGAQGPDHDQFQLSDPGGTAEPFTRVSAQIGGFGGEVNSGFAAVGPGLAPV